MRRRSCAGEHRGACRDTKVWREAEVLPASCVKRRVADDEPKASSGSPSASAAICVSTVDEPWPMSTAPLKKVSVPSRASAMRMREGFGREVLPQPYHMQAMPTPRRRRGAGGVVRCDARERRVPIALQRVEALRQPGRSAQAAGPRACGRPVRAR